VVAIGMAVLAAFAIKTWVVQAFKIPSESMLPTLAVGDRVLVRKAGFDLGDLDHGDVVVFRNQRPLPGEPEYLIKRVIGLPGDRLEARDGRLLRNDKPLEEPYVVAGSATRNLAATTVADGEVFVLGDNREDSADSREKGPVPEANLVGEAVALIWPIGRVSGL
jgi:signal peptidase I